MSEALQQLLACMRQLRDPQTGCPWDKEQTFATIAPYTIEEAYEVADAIAREDWPGLKSELGDLLFQVVFYCQMASERDWFAFDDVADAMSEKLMRRHPHVFGEGRYESHAQLHRQWEALKAQERAARAAESTQPASRLDDVPLSLPALMRAQKLQKRAASVGFDWPAAAPVFDKLDEELDELKAAVQTQSAAAIADELGDVMFTLVNLSRHLKTDAESALRSASDKFARRFRWLEQAVAADGLELSACTPEQLETYWQRAKTACTDAEP